MVIGGIRGGFAQYCRRRHIRLADCSQKYCHQQKQKNNKQKIYKKTAVFANENCGFYLITGTSPEN